MIAVWISSGGVAQVVQIILRLRFENSVKERVLMGVDALIVQ